MRWWKNDLHMTSTPQQGNYLKEWLTLPYLVFLILHPNDLIIVLLIVDVNELCRIYIRTNILKYLVYLLHKTAIVDHYLFKNMFKWYFFKLKINDRKSLIELERLMVTKTCLREINYRPWRSLSCHVLDAMPHTILYTCGVVWIKKKTSVLTHNYII